MDRQGNGLEAQRRALEAYCQTTGITDYQVFEDENISGAKTSRPALDGLMEAVRRGEFDSVVVYSFSRFARSTRHLLDALDEFQRRNVSFVSLTEKVDTFSLIGKALFTIISAIAQLERELIGEKVRNGLQNAKAKGKRVGTAQDPSWGLDPYARERRAHLPRDRQANGCLPRRCRRRNQGNEAVGNDVFRPKRLDRLTLVLRASFKVFPS